MSDIDDILDLGVEPGTEEQYTLIGDSIWMLPLDPVHSEPYSTGVPFEPPASRKTVWERLTAEA